MNKNPKASLCININPNRTSTVPGVFFFVPVKNYIRRTRPGLAKQRLVKRRMALKAAQLRAIGGDVKQGKATEELRNKKEDE